MNGKDIFELFAINKPNPGVELNFINEFTLLVAITLSAQSTDKRINIVTNDLFKVITEPKHVIQMGKDELERRIKSIGLYRNKAKNIFSMALMLLQNHNGHVPRNYEKILELPGIGRKSANVWMNTILNSPLIAVDTHVIRVSNRLGLVDSKNVKFIEEALYKIVPIEYHNKVSNWLVLHGRYICKAKSPNCTGCFLNHLCMKKGV